MPANPEFKPAFIHPYHVTNWMPFVVQESSDGFAIACRETPRRAIWSTSAIIGGGFLGFAIVIYKYADDRSWIWAPIVLGLLTTLGFHFGIKAYHQAQQKRGPILVWDKGSRTATLPRENVVLKADVLEFAALVSGSEGSAEYAAQLQIYTRDSRCYALVAADTIRQLIPMAQAIENQIGIRVRVFLEKSHRKQLWEEQPLTAVS